MKLDIPLDPVTLQGSKIHRLAARKLIQDLNDEKSFIHIHPKNADKHIPDSLVKEHIVKLGKTYNLASKYTSFIAIDERNNETVSEARTIPQKREVPQFFAGKAGFFLAFSSMNISGPARKAKRSFAVGLQQDTPLQVTPAALQKVNVNHKEPKIENLFEFLGLQSFDDESEMCHEKAEKALKKMVENEGKGKIIIEKSKEWINNWINSDSEKKEE
ncbi:unnamed protein product [Rhizophagus irregularis]|nr:unnamed protein product [Rhizophagus irregularis]